MLRLRYFTTSEPAVQVSQKDLPAARRRSGGSVAAPGAADRPGLRVKGLAGRHLVRLGFSRALARGRQKSRLPIFRSGKVTLRVSREKMGNVRASSTALS